MHKAKSQTPKPGDTFPPLENTLKTPPANDQDAVREYQKRDAQDDAFQKTNTAVADYENHFTNSWLVQYNSGRMKGPTDIVGDPNATPPTPPKGFMAVVLSVEGDGSVVYESQQVGPPACEVPAYNKITAPQH